MHTVESTPAPLHPRIGITFNLTYLSDGAEFRWAGVEHCVRCADLRARHELHEEHAGFCRFSAQLVATVSGPNV